MISQNVKENVHSLWFISYESKIWNDFFCRIIYYTSIIYAPLKAQINASIADQTFAIESLTAQLTSGIFGFTAQLPFRSEI